MSRLVVQDLPNFIKMIKLSKVDFYLWFIKCLSPNMKNNMANTLTSSAAFDSHGFCFGFVVLCFVCLFVSLFLRQGFSG